MSRGALPRRWGPTRHTDVAEFAGPGVLGAREGVARRRGPMGGRAARAADALGGWEWALRERLFRERLFRRNWTGQAGGVGPAGRKAEGPPVLHPATFQAPREPVTFLTEMSPWRCRDGRGTRRNRDHMAARAAPCLVSGCADSRLAFQQKGEPWPLGRGRRAAPHRSALPWSLVDVVRLKVPEPLAGAHFSAFWAPSPLWHVRTCSRESVPR